VVHSAGFVVETTAVRVSAVFQLRLMQQTGSNMKVHQQLANVARILRTFAHKTC
jgi:hypothetical protein